VAVLAVDIGTTNVKAAVFDGAARCYGVGSRRQDTLAPGVGWREHNPEATWRATSESIRDAVLAARCRGADIEALAVTGPRGSMLLLAPDGTPRTPVLTWQDRRSAGTTDLLSRAGVNAETYYSITGTPLDPSVALARVVWLHDRNPELIQDGSVLATPQGYVLTRLGASQPVIDFSVAAHTGLFDITELRWSELLQCAFSIPRTFLPPSVPPGEVVGALNAEVAHELGLRVGIPLTLAGSDGVCAELGGGALDVGQLYGYLGTASTIAGPLDRPSGDRSTGLIVMPGSAITRWRVLALAMAGGSALEWFGAVTSQSLHDQLERLLSESPPGARGARFMPTLAGAGAPFWDAAARGAFYGLSMSTRQADMVRAVVEGVALEMHWMLRAMREFGVEGQSLHLTGGGSRSDGWCQIIADALQVQVLRIADAELGLRGAAFYALASIGLYPDVLRAARCLRLPGDRFEPDRQLARAYAEAAEVYTLVRTSFRERGIDGRLLAATVLE
jgi:sugar (pentulose or hexulose) kinase